jgi:hypothetical protein
MAQLAIAQLNVASHDLLPSSRMRSASTPPTSRPHTAQYPRPLPALTTKEKMRWVDAFNTPAQTGRAHMLHRVQEGRQLHG